MIQDVSSFQGCVYVAYYFMRGSCDYHVTAITGQYISMENMQEVIKFCHEEGLLLFTDEVCISFPTPSVSSLDRLLHLPPLPYHLLFFPLILTASLSPCQSAMPSLPNHTPPPLPGVPGECLRERQVPLVSQSPARHGTTVR